VFHLFESRPWAIHLPWYSPRHHRESQIRWEMNVSVEHDQYDPAQSDESVFGDNSSCVSNANGSLVIISKPTGRPAPPEASSSFVERALTLMADQIQRYLQWFRDSVSGGELDLYWVELHKWVTGSSSLDRIDSLSSFGRGNEASKRSQADVQGSWHSRQLHHKNKASLMLLLFEFENSQCIKEYYCCNQKSTLIVEQ
jgi:hypothetical protein